ncbi:MAG: alkaline phosphatase D family protein [Pseudomonadota bacterium]|uniref:alkaline phosphatase D family protein n=1 Tax=Phenylobacterium sp. TaxID=1871053 RepID=UPI0025E33E4D|nr:alkaline phosphatase D family protein [Phenylobacterium sp.]MBT9471070.1 alkaline phosphatase D family protein [Phenylobacterium sp.]
MTLPVRLARRGLLAATALGAVLGSARASLAGVLGYPRLMQGPMIGHTGPSHISIWSRSSAAAMVQVEYASDRAFADAKLSAPVRADAANDLTTVIRLEGLKPATTYYARYRIDGVLDRYAPVPFKVRTAPAGPAKFRVAFGSCARFQYDSEQKIFTAVQALEPDLFLWLGDNIYADSDQPEAIADTYRRQRGVERLAPLLRSTPSLAIWDDHDFGYNDSDARSPVKEASLALFKRHWANPFYGTADTPGVFFQSSFGGVDFFHLDGRYHRDPGDKLDGPEKTMLGAGQKRWLKAALKASRAPFKILISGTGWSLAERPGDSFAAYLHERDEIFDFIRDEQISGVVCLSGDTHVGELNCIPRAEQGGYDIYDLVASPLAQTPNDKWPDQVPEARMRPVFAKGSNFGLLEFDLTGSPRLTYNLYDVTGAPVWAPLSLTPADLVNGVSTWRSKIDPKELKRLERYRAGGAYYAPETR